MEVGISEQESKYFYDIKRKMEKTAYIRLNLSERMAAYEKISITFSAVLTIYLICSSIALYADSELASSSEGHIVTLIGIIASISLLVVNLLDSAEGRPLRSFQMRETAQKILHLASSIDLELISPFPDGAHLRGFNEEYHSVIARHGQNHQVWDNDLYETKENLRGATGCAKCVFYLRHKKLWSIRLLSDWWLHAVILSISAFGFYFLADRAADALVAATSYSVG